MLCGNLCNDESVRRISGIQAGHHRALGAVVVDEVVAVLLELSDVVNQLVSRKLFIIDLTSLWLS